MSSQLHARDFNPGTTVKLETNDGQAANTGVTNDNNDYSVLWRYRTLINVISNICVTYL